MGIIYKLNFDDNSSYIGQTTRTIHSRITQHKNTQGKGCPLLAAAWESHELTSWEVLEDNVSEQELDAREIYWIAELKPVLNTLAGGKVGRGTNHPRSKYSREQIEEVLDLYLNSELSYVHISDITGVGYGLVQDICKRRAHAWVWEGKEHCVPLRTELKTYTVYNKNNQEFTATSIKDLAAATGLSDVKLKRIFGGTLNREGWAVSPHPKVTLIDPVGEVFMLNTFQAKEHVIASDPELGAYHLERLFKKFKPSKDWKISVLA